MASSLDRIRVVLCATSHPGNIGASARAMQTMGLSRLVLVNPLRFPDADAEAMAAGAGSILNAARIAASLDEALAGSHLSIGFSARRREFGGTALAVRPGMQAGRQHAVPGGVGLGCGTEVSGRARTGDSLAQ